MNRVLAHTGARYPIVQAPMGWIARTQLASAVSTVETALKCVEAGVYGLVVEGAEGGGFKDPEEISTLVLLQGIRARTDIPMIAAGCICDGRGMAAAFALGAEGIQMGTRFVSCSESPVHANYKNAIVQAKETGTLVLNKKSTPCIRALKSERTKAIHDAGLMAPDALKGMRDVYFHGDMEAAPALAGQSAGLIAAVKPARAIIEETVTRSFAITVRLGGLASWQ